VPLPIGSTQCEVFFLKKPTREQIGAFLDAQSTSQLSYKQQGLSLKSEAPSGFNIDHNRVRLGSGEDVWKAGRQAMEEWKPFAISWLQLCWPETPIENGNDVAILVSHHGFWSLNACRIVARIDEQAETSMRFGFAYGTLEDHSESGEESFSIIWNEADDSVWYDIFAFSQPRAFLAKVGYPLSRRLQHRFSQASKQAMMAVVRHSANR
jgi:uncharacterized protein (UPF0548 family)